MRIKKQKTPEEAQSSLRSLSTETPISGVYYRYSNVRPWRVFPRTVAPYRSFNANQLGQRSVTDRASTQGGVLVPLHEKISYLPYLIYILKILEVNK